MVRDMVVSQQVLSSTSVNDPIYRCFAASVDILFSVGQHCNNPFRNTMITPKHSVTFIVASAVSVLQRNPDSSHQNQTDSQLDKSVETFLMLDSQAQVPPRQ